MTSAERGSRPPLWRDVRVLRAVFQAVVVALVVAFGLWLWGNVQANASQSNIPLTFDYLYQPGDMTVPGSPLRASQSVRDAIAVGLGNTVRVSAAGIVAATVLGTLIGIARLSSNWLLSRLARSYVELLRNIPLLIIIVFSYISVALRLPRIEDAREFGGVFIPSVRGVGMPWFDTGERGWSLLGIVIASGAAAYLAHRLQRRFAERTGRESWMGSAGVAAFVIVAVVGQIALGSPLSLTTPDIEGRRIIGGMTMLPEFAALFAALTLYTSSHVAEIVRGSIQAVPKGQFEAATALGLPPAKRMRLVILPQAMRIALPALGNQYLNLTKNSSLGVAISYFELTKVTNVSIGNRAPAVPSYALLLVLYLVLSLLISAMVNVANRRLALVER